MNTKTKVLGGFLLGTALGISAGMLLAPRSGRKTRKKLMNQSKAMANQIADRARHKLEAAKETYNHKLETIAKNGKSTVDELSEAIHVR